VGGKDGRAALAAVALDGRSIVELVRSHSRDGATRFSQFLKFGAVGSAGYAVNLLVYTGLLAVGLHYVVAAVGAFLIAVTHNCALNRAWTFKSRHGPILAQSGRFFMVSVAVLGLSVLTLLGLTSLGLGEIPAQALATLFMAPVAFIANRRWSFRIQMTGEEQVSPRLRAAVASALVVFARVAGFLAVDLLGLAVATVLIIALRAGGVADLIALVVATQLALAGSFVLLDRGVFRNRGEGMPLTSRAMWHFLTANAVIAASGPLLLALSFTSLGYGTANLTSLAGLLALRFFVSNNLIWSGEHNVGKEYALGRAELRVIEGGAVTVETVPAVLQATASNRRRA
jgi:putative flippase GtrA